MLASDETVKKIFGDARYRSFCDSGGPYAIISVQTNSADSASSEYDLAAKELLRRSLPIIWTFARAQRCLGSWGGTDQYTVVFSEIANNNGPIYFGRMFYRDNDGYYRWHGFENVIEWHKAQIAFWIKVIFSVLALILIVILALNWEGLLRLYFLLTPHPATDMVQSAVNAGVELDGEAFSAIFQPVPGGRVEKEVRSEQAKNLAELARRSRAELDRKAEELRQRIKEEAAYRAAHRDLHDAAIEQQLAKVRADAFAKIEEFLKRSRRNDER